MIRTVLTPKNKELQIIIPEKYIGKKIEVIAFAVDEPLNENKKIANSKFRGLLKLTTSQEKALDLHINEIRNEW